MARESKDPVPLVELQDVTQVFVDGGGSCTPLAGVTRRIDPGQFVCIQGHSGSGKSTLLKILGCLGLPTTGSYQFAGQDISRLNPNDLARLRRTAFGFVFRDYNLLQSATVQDNVELPAIYTTPERRHRRDRARSLLMAFGLRDRVGDQSSELSGGKQQRVAIVRAVVNNPQVSIADEPTDALDSAQGRDVTRMLKELARRGHTIVTASHDPMIAARCRDSSSSRTRDRRAFGNRGTEHDRSRGRGSEDSRNSMRDPGSSGPAHGSREGVVAFREPTHTETYAGMSRVNTAVPAAVSAPCPCSGLVVLSLTLVAVNVRSRRRACGWLSALRMPIPPSP